MAFTLNTRNIDLRVAYQPNGEKRVILRGEGRLNSGVWYPASEINLNPYFENLDGAFYSTESPSGGFADSADSITLEQNRFLHAKLRNQNGVLVPAVFDLGLCVGVSAGNLTFKALPIRESILTSSSCPTISGSTLNIHLMKRDGKFHPLSLDLNQHYSNDNGRFRSNATGFYQSARNVSLSISSTQILLVAELLSGGTYKPATANLSEDIINNYGNLLFLGRPEPQPKTFWIIFSEFFDHVPVIGLVFAGVNALIGNYEAANRATAFSANSTIVMVGIVIGGFFGGPLGAAIGAGLATPIGILAESNILQPQYEPDGYQRATLERYIFESLRNAVTAGAAGALSKWLGTLSEAAMIKAFQEINKSLGGRVPLAVEKLSGALISDVLKSVFDALRTGIIPPAWRESEARVASLILEGKLSFRVEPISY
jgi:hypothetical protein